jgi:hypothetical protein
MPPTPYSRLGYNGMDWPQPDLLWDTAFGLRFGLFASAPILLLSLYPRAWAAPLRLVGRREAWTIVAFTAAFLLFSAANQFGRLQFNSGIRYMVPVVPFLFLIVAGVLMWYLGPAALNQASSAGGRARLKALVVGGFTAVSVYWSWCLAMYRDVEQGLGVLEPLLHVTAGGPRLPWLTTLQSLGYVPAGPWAWLPILLAALAVWLLWGRPGLRSLGLLGHDSRRDTPTRG